MKNLSLTDSFRLSSIVTARIAQISTNSSYKQSALNQRLSED